MIHYLEQQNIFNLDVQCLVNPVNCVGVMGAGLALQFKQKYPDMYDHYKETCDAGRLEIGLLHIYFSGDTIIINFPTKHHWKEKSKIESIDNGMKCLFEVIKIYNITSIAIPKLGCGLGGLTWYNVKAVILKHLTPIEQDVEIYLV